MGTIMLRLWRATLAMMAVAMAAALPWPGDPSVFAALRAPSVAVTAEAGPGPLVDIQGTRLIGADDAGRRQWELQATSLQIDQHRDTMVLTGVTGWLYGAGTRRLEVRAPRAVYFAQTKTVELSGGVSGSAPDGRRFSSDRVRWTATRLTAAGRIVLAQNGMTVRADVMTTDAALNRVVFEGHVSVTLTSE